MKIQTYEGMTIEIVQETKYPAEVIALALSLTMRSDPGHIPAKFTSKLGKFLLDADHTSPLEHAHYTFLIQGVSRSFLAQITRHRMGSFTSASQHYQNYEDYPAIIAGNSQLFESSLNDSYSSYLDLIDAGVLKEEARQVLPNACAVNLLWSVNARSLITFLRQRLCYRNVKEMQIFAGKVLSLAKTSFPEVFNYVGPQCFEERCKQGKMKCNVGPWVHWRK